MPLKPLDSITTVQDMIDYVVAEANDAASQCPAVFNEYANIVKWLQDSAVDFDTSNFQPLQQIGFGESEDSLVATARNMVYAARKTWYSAGCAKPGTVTGFLLIAGGLVAVMLLTSKKPRRRGKRRGATRRRQRR